jgi:tetratricopeptide (TPR) repeat protein
MAAEESFGAAMVARPQSKADGVGQEEAKGEASEEIISGYHMGSAAQPEDAGALFLKAQKQARTGDAEGAVASYARFLARHPEDRRAPEAAWARAGLLEKLGRASEAESARAELLSRYPRSTQAELARRRIAPGSAGAPRAAPAAPQKSPASPAEDLGEAAQ